MSTVYLIPMAGLGSRFAREGLTAPKASLKIEGQSFLLHALSGLPISANDRLILIAQRAHGLPGRLNSSLREAYPDLACDWIEIEGTTEGQLCTALLAKDRLAPEDSLVIHNCDTFFRSGLASLLEPAHPCEGALSCVQVEGDAWSFARLNERREVIETAEKRRISPWASVGLYYFKRAEVFVRLAEQMIRENERVNGEFYVAPLYNRMIREGRLIALDTVTEFRPMGTPEDLQKYWGRSHEQFKRENLA